MRVRIIKHVPIYPEYGINVGRVFDAVPSPLRARGQRGAVEVTGDRDEVVTLLRNEYEIVEGTTDEF